MFEKFLCTCSSSWLCSTSTRFWWFASTSPTSVLFTFDRHIVVVLSRVSETFSRSVFSELRLSFFYTKDVHSDTFLTVFHMRFRSELSAWSKSTSCFTFLSLLLSENFTLASDFVKTEAFSTLRLHVSTYTAKLFKHDMYFFVYIFRENRLAQFCIAHHLEHMYCLHNVS